MINCTKAGVGEGDDYQMVTYIIMQMHDEIGYKSEYNAFCKS